MNTVKLSSLALLGALTLVACKEAPQEIQESETQSVINEQLAMTEDFKEVGEAMEEVKTTYLYVTARTGLSLRAFNNLNSEKLAIIPYGTRLEVLEHEPQQTMKVNNIKGGMDKVNFNRKSGYVFNGYLSKYFPPEDDMLPAGYAKELKEVYPNVSYTEADGGTASKPVNTETLMLPGAEWHEAYFIAQKIFDIPNEFTFPKQTGKETQQFKGPKKETDSWFDALNVSRDANGLVELQYSYDAKKVKRTVSITATEKGMKIQQIRAYK
ncbi:SH3 domain-containing protein [Gilvibacter sp.]|uniref:SH3 domain-containing protein n=1 Tax=Gilvibacter sp. TaxID=2729997 RepID=UPI0025BE1F14|nr:SH3 domain-containing protein [Gilvibacter sp.]NQX78741.1 SH3 domain-containing protein [Gilvibacter sp.]